MEDEDYVDEVTGETIRGLRKYGPSKEHRPNPVVEMGLFMDTDGIPLSMCITSGSDNEQTTAIPLEKKLTQMFRKKKFIYCADVGLGSLNIRNFNSVCTALNAVWDLGLDKKYYQPKELNKKIKKISK